MAKDTVRDKIKREIERGVVDECQVVFVLSRIRKYIEFNNSSKDAKYEPVKFYCNWALHTKITDIRSVRDVLAESTDYDSNDTGFVWLEHFRRVMSDFLVCEGLPNKWVSNGADWDKLKEILHDIYGDTPLIIRSPIKNDSCRHLQETVTIKKQEGILGWSIQPEVIGKPFDINWF